MIPQLEEYIRRYEQEKNNQLTSAFVGLLGAPTLKEHASHRNKNVCCECSKGNSPQVTRNAGSQGNRRLKTASAMPPQKKPSVPRPLVTNRAMMTHETNRHSERLSKSKSANNIQSEQAPSIGTAAEIKQKQNSASNRTQSSLMWTLPTVPTMPSDTRPQFDEESRVDPPLDHPQEATQSQPPSEDTIDVENLISELTTLTLVQAALDDLVNSIIVNTKLEQQQTQRQYQGQMTQTASVPVCSKSISPSLLVQDLHLLEGETVGFTHFGNVAAQSMCRKGLRQLHEEILRNLSNPAIFNAQPSIELHDQHEESLANEHDFRMLDTMLSIT